MMTQLDLIGVVWRYVGRHCRTFIVVQERSIPGVLVFRFVCGARSASRAFDLNDVNRGGEPAALVRDACSSLREALRLPRLVKRERSRTEQREG